MKRPVLGPLAPAAHGQLVETVREFKPENACNPTVSKSLKGTTRRNAGISAATALTMRRVGSTQFAHGLNQLSVRTRVSEEWCTPDEDSGEIDDDDPHPFDD